MLINTAEPNTAAAAAAAAGLQTAIAKAVSDGAGVSAMQAASKGMDYARLTTKVSADPWVRHNCSQIPHWSHSVPHWQLLLQSIE
jgi:hypothetical protein